MTKTLKLFSVFALIASLVLVLTGCGASSYQKKLEKAGYEVSVTAEEDLEEEYKYNLVGFKSLLDQVSVTCYKKVADAKKAEEDFNAQSAKIGFVERKGAVIIYSITSEGLEAVK